MKPDFFLKTIMNLILELGNCILYS